MSEQDLLIQAIETVAHMSSPQIAEISKLLSASTVNFIKCRETAQKLQKLNGNGDKFDAKRVAELINSLSFLRASLGSAAYVVQDVKKNLPDFLEFSGVDAETPVEVTEELSQKLVNAFSGDADTEQWHETGLLDVVIDFDSFVDLRPVFVEKTNGGKEGQEKDFEYRKVLPMIVFRIAVQKDFAGPSSYVFQMTETELASLEAEVSRARRRLSLAKSLIEEKFSSK